jgi:hypothetical protein
VFDRSGCYSTGAFDIHEEPERFIQVIAGYIMMNEEELGLDTCMEQDADGRYSSHLQHLRDERSMGELRKEIGIKVRDHRSLLNRVLIPLAERHFRFFMASSNSFLSISLAIIHNL